MPADDCRGLYNNKSRLPIAEYLGHPNEYNSVNIFKFWLLTFTHTDIKLLPEHEIFEDQALPRFEQQSEKLKNELCKGFQG